MNSEVNRLEFRKHIFRFAQSFEPHVLTCLAVTCTHRLPGRILMRRRNGLCRFPFEYFDNCSVRSFHDVRRSVCRESLASEDWKVFSRKLQKELFLSRERTISDNYEPTHNPSPFTKRQADALGPLKDITRLPYRISYAWPLRPDKPDFRTSPFSMLRFPIASVFHNERSGPSTSGLNRADS
jgi:hypothetical protein